MGLQKYGEARSAGVGRGRALGGARVAPFPRRPELQLATLVDSPPEGDEWLHEIKVDGYRLLGALRSGSVRLLSRNGHDWTARFPGVAEALRALPAKTALLDGEAVVFGAGGLSSFQALQAALGRGSPSAEPCLVLFDCLYLDGRDLRALPLGKRKEVLRALLARGPKGRRLRFSDHVVGRGAEFFAAACARGAEGIVSKRVEAPYRAGRARAWLKVKCSQHQELVIVGYTDPKGSRVGLGALLLAAYDASGALRYCGKVGTGFDAAGLRTLEGRLRRLERVRSPLAEPARMRDVHWVAPRLVAEVAFSEWTREGRVRHPVFLGLREDKDAREVRVEAPA